VSEKMLLVFLLTTTKIALHEAKANAQGAGGAGVFIGMDARIDD
jgi:hypothetical protein